MSILDQVSQSQLSNKDKTSGIAVNSSNSSNYDNTLITTKGQGQVIQQIDPANQSNLAPAPGASSDQSYLTTIFDQTLK